MSKMEEPVLLVDSIICRLCAEENINGALLFNGDEVDSELSTIINKYLPLKVIFFKYENFIMVYNLISYLVF